MFKNLAIFNSTTKKNLQIYSHNFVTFYTKTPCFSIYSLELLDVSYTGKTYKWSVKLNFWKLVFNRVHPTILFSKQNLILKKMAKTKFRILVPTRAAKQSLINLFYITRLYNIFTHRGLKIKGQLFFKKRGKVSTYR